MSILKINRDDFLLNFFEKNFFFEKKSIESIDITWDDIDEILYGWNLNEGLIHLFKDGKLDPSIYTEEFYDLGINRRRILKDSFNNLMLNGATLVLNRMDIKSTKINKLNKYISHFVKEKTVANGYIAFGGNGTFAKHWDTHDVFAIQLIGRKRWKLFQPTFPLPLRHQTSKNHKSECPEEPVFDEILDAGDILYIPRGWWHEAIPLENEETFHIAVGVHTANITDYLSWCSTNIFGENEIFRKSIVTELLQSFNETDLISKLNNENHFHMFKEAQLQQDKTVSHFKLSKISAMTKNIINKVDNPLLLLNTSYKIDYKKDKLIINGTIINIDEKSKDIFKIIDGNLITRSDLINRLCKNDAEIDKVTRFIDSMVMNDIISEF